MNTNQSQDTKSKKYPNRLRECRERLGLRQCDIAAILGHASPDRISHWERGIALPGITNLFKLSIMYTVPHESLYPELHNSHVEMFKLQRTQPINQLNPQQDLQVFKTLWHNRHG